MLRKLLKYELKATSRIFLPMYGLLFLFSIAMLIMFKTTSGTFSTTPMAIIGFLIGIGYGALVAAIFVMTVVISIQRFNRNLLGHEGYLSLTLPTTIAQHIWAKLLVSCLWVILSCVSLAISIIIMAADDNMVRVLSSIFSSIGKATQLYGGSVWAMGFSILAVIVTALLQCILGVYMAIAVGSLCPKHRVLTGIGAYTLGGIVQGTAGYFFFRGFDKATSAGGILESWFQTLSARDNISQVEFDIRQMHMLSISLSSMTIFFLVFCAIFFVITHQILKNHLNLQ
jgi:hypothetical protein